MRANIKLFDVFASLHIEPYLVFSVAVVRRNVKQQNLEEGPITSVSRVCTDIFAFKQRHRREKTFLGLSYKAMMH